LSNISKHHLLRDAAGRLILHENRYVDRYDAQIRYLDDLTAELLERVDRAGTAVVVVGDHGETLGERYHAMDHGGQVFDEQIRIPLILNSPGLVPRRVGGAVETVDLTPTLLDVLGILVPTKMSSKGSSLLPLLRGEGDGRRFVFSAARALSERYADRGYRLDPERQIHAIRSWRWKLIRYPSFAQDVLELYDLESDPFERSDVASRFEQTRDALRGELERWWQDASPATIPSLEMDEETMNKLRALGYLGD
jgi:arylsulfatase A-like enzyme